MAKNPSDKDFTQKFASLEELQTYARSQFLVLLQANKRIEDLESENKHLLSVIDNLKALSAANEASPVPATPEQELCETELRRLRDITLERALTLEETKQMDLLVKNLYISKGKPSTLGKAKKTKDVSDTELIGRALMPDGEDE